MKMSSIFQSMKGRLGRRSDNAPADIAVTDGAAREP
jgi:hypothetical protein